jgi:hypothetical protein
MYFRTFLTLDHETAKAPYPDCQANVESWAAWVLIHFEDVFLTFSVTWLRAVGVRGAAVGCGVPTA